MKTAQNYNNLAVIFKVGTLVCLLMKTHKYFAFLLCFDVAKHFIQALRNREFNKFERWLLELYQLTHTHQINLEKDLRGII